MVVVQKSGVGLLRLVVVFRESGADVGLLDRMVVHGVVRLLCPVVVVVRGSDAGVSLLSQMPVIVQRVRLLCPVAMFVRMSDAGVGLLSQIVVQGVVRPLCPVVMLVRRSDADVGLLSHVVVRRTHWRDVGSAGCGYCTMAAAYDKKDEVYHRGLKLTRMSLIQHI